MLSVQIKINATQIFFIYAHRVKGNAGEFCEYDIFGWNAEKIGHIGHHYDAGALQLSMKMCALADEWYKAHPIIDKAQTKITGLDGTVDNKTKRDAHVAVQ